MNDPLYATSGPSGPDVARTIVRPSALALPMASAKPARSIVSIPLPQQRAEYRREPEEREEPADVGDRGEDDRRRLRGVLAARFEDERHRGAGDARDRHREDHREADDERETGG